MSTLTSPARVRKKKATSLFRIEITFKFNGSREQTYFTRLLSSRKHSCTTEKSNLRTNRPRSIYQYSNMAPRLSGQTSIFGVVFFVSKSLLGIERQKKLEKFAILTRKPRSHARILIYRTWPISTAEKLHIE